MNTVTRVSPTNRAFRPYVGFGALLTIVLLATGCKGDRAEVTSPTTTVEESVRGDTALVTVDFGEGGISLENNFEEIARLCPVPEKGNPTSANDLALPGERHYGWETPELILDVYARGNAITTISMLHQKMTARARSAEIDRELERFDEPDENAEGTKTAAYLWRDGERLRIIVEFSSGDDGGILRVVGTESALIQRGFPVGQLSELVKAFDQGAFQ